VFKSFIESKTRIFMVGALCGAALVAVCGIAFVWWTHPTRSPEESARVIVMRGGGDVA
jgi:hypothetical protein